MPQPEKLSSPISVVGDAAARARGSAMPVHSAWPALELRTRHGRFCPSSASA